MILMSTSDRWHAGPSNQSDSPRDLAITFNLRHKRRGHLFQNHYKSIVCEEDPYFLELVRYTYLNPLRSHLVKDVGQLGSSFLRNQDSYLAATVKY
jgi:hypothetical protein